MQPHRRDVDLGEASLGNGEQRIGIERQLWMRRVVRIDRDVLPRDLASLVDLVERKADLGADGVTIKEPAAEDQIAATDPEARCHRQAAIARQVQAAIDAHRGTAAIDLRVAGGAAKDQLTSHA